MNSLYEKAARAAGYELQTDTSGPLRAIHYQWVHTCIPRARSRTAYLTKKQAWEVCCEYNRISLHLALDDFTRHYLIAMLWTNFDSLGKAFGLPDITPESLNKAYLDCQKFQMENRDNLAVAYEEYEESGATYHPDAGSPEACAGHDFWLSRNGHGTGFWDRGLSVGEALHTAARAYGEADTYAWRGKVHL